MEKLLRCPLAWLESTLSLAKEDDQQFC